MRLNIFLRQWLPCVAVAASVYILYLKCFGFQPVGLDDVQLVSAGIHYAENPGLLSRIFTGPLLSGEFNEFYRPFLMVSFVVEGFLVRLVPFIHHATNVFLHALSACLVYALLKRLRYSSGVALFLALVFAVHPLAASVVAWLPGRNDSLLACGVLGSFLLLVRYGETRRAAWFFLHLLCLFAALLTKETAVALIPVSMVYLWLVRRRDSGDGVPYVAPLLCWLLAGGLWFRLHEAFTVPQKPIADYWHNLVVQVPAFFQAAGMIVYPGGLSNYPLLDFSKVIVGLAAAGAIACCVRGRLVQRPRMVYFGAAWFVFFMAPTMISRMVLEHRMYVPMVGFLMIAGEIIAYATAAAPRKKLYAAGAALAICFLAVRTFSYTDVFMNRRPYWSHALKTAPGNSLVHTALGRYWNDRKMPGPAIVEYKTALQLCNTDIERGNIRYELAVAYLQAGRMREAEDILRGLIAGPYPRKENYYFRYAMLCAWEGRTPEAEEYYRTALRLDPFVLDFYRGLASLYNHEKKDSDRDAVLIALADRAVDNPGELRYVTDAAAVWWQQNCSAVIKLKGRNP